MGGTTTSTTSSNNVNQYNAKINSSNPYSQTTLTPTKDAFGKTTSVTATQNFAPGTLYSQIYDYGNKNINRLINEWENPTLNTAENQAKLHNYNKIMQQETGNALQNQIINPLTQNNMLRSSQATNLYNNLNNQIADKYDTFTNDLIANASNDAYNKLQALMAAYAQGQSAMNGDMNSVIQMANGNSSSSGTSTSSSS